MYESSKDLSWAAAERAAGVKVKPFNDDVKYTLTNGGDDFEGEEEAFEQFVNAFKDIQKYLPSKRYIVKYTRSFKDPTDTISKEKANIREYEAEFFKTKKGNAIRMYMPDASQAANSQFVVVEDTEKDVLNVMKEIEKEDRNTTLYRILNKTFLNDKLSTSDRDRAVTQLIFLIRNIESNGKFSPAAVKLSEVFMSKLKKIDG